MKKLPPLQWIFLIALTAFILFFLYYPTLYIFKKAFFPEGSFSFAFFLILAQNKVMLRAIAASFAIGVMVTALCLAVSLPLAWFATRYRLKAQGLLNGWMMVPMVLPPFVGAIGMKQFFARFGTLNLLLLKCGAVNDPINWLGSGFWGVVILETLHLFPILYLNLSAALSNIDPSMEEAAWNLGSSPFSFARKILLPLAAPGLFAGMSIVFIWSVTDLGTPLVLEYRNVVAYQIFNMVGDIYENPMGYALVVFVLAWVACIYFATKYFFTQRETYSSVRAFRSAEKKDPSFTLHLLAIASFAAIGVLAVIPHAMVVFSAVSQKWFMTILPERLTLEYFRGSIEHPLGLLSVRNSLFLSSATTLLDMAVGLFAAFLLARYRFWGRSFLDFSVMLPLALPGLILAFGYVGTFAGTFLDPRNNPFPLLIAAYGIRRLPFMVRAVDAGIRQVHPALEEASLNLGASPFKTIRRIILPLVSSNMLAGSILVFAFAMLEVSDSLILAMKEIHYPLTKAIYALANRITDGFPLASALGVFSMFLLAAGMLVAGKILGKKMGELFRM